MALIHHREEIRRLVEEERYTYAEVSTHLTQVLGAPERGTSVRNLREFCFEENIMRTAHRYPPHQRLEAVAYAAHRV